MPWQQRDGLPTPLRRLYLTPKPRRHLGSCCRLDTVGPPIRACGSASEGSRARRRNVTQPEEGPSPIRVAWYHAVPQFSAPSHSPLKDSRYQHRHRRSTRRPQPGGMRYEQSISWCRVHHLRPCQSKQTSLQICSAHATDVSTDMLCADMRGGIWSMIERAPLGNKASVLAQKIEIPRRVAECRQPTEFLR